MVRGLWKGEGNETNCRYKMVSKVVDLTDDSPTAKELEELKQNDEGIEFLVEGSGSSTELPETQPMHYCQAEMQPEPSKLPVQVYPETLPIDEYPETQPMSDYEIKPVAKSFSAGKSSSGANVQFNNLSIGSTSAIIESNGSSSADGAEVIFEDTTIEKQSSSDGTVEIAGAGAGEMHSPTPKGDDGALPSTPSTIPARPREAGSFAKALGQTEVQTAPQDPTPVMAELMVSKAEYDRIKASSTYVKALRLSAEDAALGMVAVRPIKRIRSW